MGVWDGEEGEEEVEVEKALEKEEEEEEEEVGRTGVTAGLGDQCECLPVVSVV